MCNTGTFTSVFETHYFFYVSYDIKFSFYLQVRKKTPDMENYLFYYQAIQIYQQVGKNHILLLLVAIALIINMKLLAKDFSGEKAKFAD